jgi:hypothetical protein
MGAFTGETPEIDHICKWGSKCFYYIDKKTLLANKRHDKLVNPARVGVYMGHSKNTTKHYKVYSPERGYTILASRVIIKESVKGGTVDLRIRNSTSGPQGTMNVAPDRKPRGRPKGSTKDKDTEPTLSTGTLTKLTTTPQVEIPPIVPQPNVPASTKEDMPDADRANPKTASKPVPKAGPKCADNPH